MRKQIAMIHSIFISIINQELVKGSEMIEIISSTHYNDFCFQQKTGVSFSLNDLRGRQLPIIFITMERKKPEKLNFALPLNNSDYFDSPALLTHSKHTQNLNESLFFKYASSIIQVVAEDRLDNSSAGNYGQHPRNAIFEISQVKEFEGGGGSEGGSSCRESNNYNNMAAKMKKKAPNRKTLLYNFSNLTLFSQKIHPLLQKPLKCALEMIKNVTFNSDYNKTKKEKKRASFHSGYTTSTSNEDKTSKRSSKRMTQQRKRQMHEESANSIKGWLQFKFLLFLSHTYQNIKEFATKQNIKPPLAVSQVSTIKQQPLEKFYLTQYNQDNSISIARELTHNISSSLVYTADQNFEFTQKEVTLTTPEKFGSEDRISMPPLPNVMRKNNINQESFVESYKPKEIFSHPNRHKIPKEVVIPKVSKPLYLAENEDRLYLTIRTNIYELPMLAEHELRPDRQRVIEDSTFLGDAFAKSQPQTRENIESIVNELKEASNLFKAKIKNTQKITQQREENKVIERKSQSNKLTQKRGQAQTKKLASSSSGQLLKQQKKDVQILQNYYFFNENTQPKTSKAILASPSLLLQQKKPFEQIKSVQSILKTSSKPQRKNDKLLRIERTLVNEFTLQNRGKEALHVLSVRNQVNAHEKMQGFGYQGVIPERREEKSKSHSKISIVMPHPQHKQLQKVNMYHQNEPVRIESRPSVKIDNRHLNSPYGYPISNQKPKSPLFTYHQKQSPRLVSPNNYMFPQNSPQAIYQMAPKPVPSTPQRIVSQLRSNQQLRTQQQMQRLETIVRNSPGKVVNPSYLLNSQERRTIGMPSQLRHDDKKSFYSPQMPKDAYLISPQKHNNQIQQTPKMQNLNNNMRRMCEPQYFTKETSPAVQIKAVNFNNNYYISGPRSARQPPIIQPLRNVFHQEDPSRRQTYLQRPPSCRHSTDRGVPFPYSPLESEMEHPQRSNHFSKNSSELSRPKSMNQKIFITLRKDK